MSNRTAHERAMNVLAAIPEDGTISKIRLRGIISMMSDRLFNAALKNLAVAGAVEWTQGRCLRRTTL